MEPGNQAERRTPSVFVFNPFTEGYIARGNAFTPVKHQASLVRDLANLPQFLCEHGDIVLLAQKPSPHFLASLEQAGFPVPEFVELKAGRIDPAGSLFQRRLGSLRPWAWGPDSVQLLAPLFDRVTIEASTPARYFNDGISRLYSKAWSAVFLSKVLDQCRGSATQTWLCSGHEAGVAVDTLENALKAVSAIRRRGHHRVVVKEALGLAGHNALRLWEPEILPAQRRWLARALTDGRQLVVEPWLERELDFSVQMEMGPRSLRLCGYTGLLTDLRGQFLANWAEPNYCQGPPAKVAGAFGSVPDTSERLERLYREIFAFLESELQRAGFIGPVSIDAFVYRTSQGDCRLKPVVEINPRYTMGRLTLDLMKHACVGASGFFRLVNRPQARAEGFADFTQYASSLLERLPLRLEAGPPPRIRQGALCLNDPSEAQVCLATFQVTPSVPVNL